MSSYKVLLVEDDAGDADLMREYLERGTALSVELAPTLCAALQLLAQQSFDALVLDLNLPDTSGPETLSQAKTGVGEMPIIVTSGAVSNDLRQRLLDAGADEVFDKDEATGKLFSRSVLYLIEHSRARARHRDLEQLLEATPDAIVVVNSCGAVRYFNLAALQLFGVTREELLGVPLGFAVSDGTPTEIEVPRKDGGRMCEMRVVPLGWKGEAALLASIRDVTERKVADQLRARSSELELQNRRIQEANRLKSQFLANMSHELRTPLNAIIGFSQLLHAGAVDPTSPQHNEFLGDILTSSRHLLQLINDVLDLAKVEAGKMDFRPEPVDLAKLVGEVVAILRTLAAEKRIRLEVALDREPSLREVQLDPARFKQVLYNYLSNAIKFTPEGGRAIVRTRREGADSFRLEVQDTGVGIAPEDVGRLFVEFQQLQSGIEKPHQGTGLGLALTRRIVEAQGGTVGVSSAPSKGSLFYAILPRRSDVPAETRRIGSVAGRAGGGCVLVVEDDPRDQQLLLSTLSEAGYGVEIARTGAEALIKLREKAFDAVTLDMLLPDMSGLDVLAALRSSGKSQRAVVIVATVLPDGSAVSGYAVHEVLHKPLDTAQLLDSLQRAGVTRPERGPVLVVDDDPHALRLIEDSLGRLGYKVIACEGGASGLAAARESPPAAVILDLLMPEMDGFEVLEKFRRIPACKRTPVLIWTSKELTREDQALVQSSAQGVLMKSRGGGKRLLKELQSFLTAPM